MFQGNVLEINIRNSRLNILNEEAMTYGRTAIAAHDPQGASTLFVDVNSEEVHLPER